MDDLKERLQYEFDAEEDSFLIKIRLHLQWDHEKIVQVMNLFYDFILNSDQDEMLERKIASGFWYYGSFVKDWTSHENFRANNKYSDDYFNQVYEIIFLLVDWYFTGECPFTDHKAFIEEIDCLNRLI